MIDEPAPERLGGGRKAACGAEVRSAGAGVATWMVVRQQDRRAVVQRRVDDDGAQREGDAAAVSLVPRDMEAIGLPVEMCDPQRLALRVCLGEAAGEERTCGVQPVDLQRRFGTLIPHATAVADAAPRDDAKRVAFGA